MIKPGRSFSSSAYKHGFNTNESDAEVTGSFGNTYTAEYWMYDSRLGRRWERDPITYPWQSPYACFNNNPIYYNDVRGLEGEGNPKYDCGDGKTYEQLVNGKWVTGNYNLDKIAQTLLIVSNSTVAVSSSTEKLITIKPEISDRTQIVAGINKLHREIEEANKTPEDHWSYDLPVVGKAWASGTYLSQGNYHDAGINFSFALIEIATWGYTFETRAASETIVLSTEESVIVRAEESVILSAGESAATKGGMGLADDFLASATKSWGDQGLTVAGRALQKHAGREGSVFQGIKFSHKTANQDGLNLINQIMGSKNQIIQQAENGGKLIFDKTTGRGFGVSREGLFNGFRELGK